MLLTLFTMTTVIAGTIAELGDLRQRLSPSEWRTIMGHGDHDVSYDVIYPSVSDSDGRRTRRSSDSDSRTLVLDAPGLSRNWTLELVVSSRLLDPQLVILSRWGNRTETLSAGLAERGCYYHSRHHHQDQVTAAVNVCGGVRGVIKPGGDEFYVINPLPRRFQKRSSNTAAVPHVIVRKQVRESLAHNPSFCAEESNHVTVSTRGGQQRVRRAIDPRPVHVETAVFVDSDMYRLMADNFPRDTEKEVVRFVLALVNAVQLLYHDPSLGQSVTFVMKRLEILHSDPSGLERSHDIDRFLGNFCVWQRGENPTGDHDPLHWDHALILTGLDLFVRSKNGKVSSQVVGLAPVAGMCTATSSCTVNEGRHFESVYVVAHEIGHNLGMRHDGPLADNNCDPTSYLMSPTLGSGKITWSQCSRHYLQQFLRSPQSHCLMDHNEGKQLDHSSHGVLPGERFNADQQCMLKYGAGSGHATSQPLQDLCRDLHCQREHYTWTSHPALEGTACGQHKWCRSGRCVARSSAQLVSPAADGDWGPWSPYSECASGCLQGEGGALGSGSTGIMFAHRQCDNPRPDSGRRGCPGSDRKYKTCVTNQCENLPRTTVRDFADEVCLRAREVDSDLVGTGFQKVSSSEEEACTVWCYRRNGGSKSGGWPLPDGTRCETRPGATAMFCVSGLCRQFTCDGDGDEVLSLSRDMCQVSRGRRGEAAVGVWLPTSDCYHTCVSPGSGIRLVERRACRHCNATASVQLCQQDTAMCGDVKTTIEYATVICSQYSQRVRRLSGMGMQLTPIVEDPDRSCRVACQDESVRHRFYLVNGDDGWFPFGTDCAKGDPTKNAFCIRGKCLEFGSDDTPLYRASGRRRRRGVTSELDEMTLADMVHYLNQTGNQRKEPIIAEAEVIDLNNPVIADLSEWYGLNDVDSSYTF